MRVETRVKSGDVMQATRNSPPRYRREQGWTGVMEAGHSCQANSEAQLELVRRAAAMGTNTRAGEGEGVWGGGGANGRRRINDGASRW